MELDLDCDEKEVMQGNAFPDLADGDYDLEVLSFKPRTSSSGHAQFIVRFKVLNEAGQKASYIVTFIPAGQPGHGYAKMFLKAIGQPYKGKVKVNTADWIGQKTRGHVVAVETPYHGKMFTNYNIKGFVEPESPEYVQTNVETVSKNPLGE